MRLGLANIYEEAAGAPYGIGPRVYCAVNPLRYTFPSSVYDKAHFIPKVHFTFINPLPSAAFNNIVEANPGFLG